MIKQGTALLCVAGLLFLAGCDRKEKAASKEVPVKTQSTDVQAPEAGAADQAEQQEEAAVETPAAEPAK